MRWTRQRPLHEGWYWYRGPEVSRDPGSYPDGYLAVRVDGGPAYAMHFFIDALDPESGTDIATLTGEWMGPIAPEGGEPFTLIHREDAV